jgi:ribosomal protein S18 acetylase RimI-like enzyme
VEIFEIEVGTDRRKGIGKRLILELLRRVPMTTHLVWVLTRTDNHIACCFYSSSAVQAAGRLCATSTAKVRMR